MAWLLRILAVFPLPVLHLLGWWLYLLAFYVVRWRVPLARANIDAAFPEKTAKERERILRDCYRNLGAALMEGIWGYGASAEALARRVRFLNPGSRRKLEHGEPLGDPARRTRVQLGVAAARGRRAPRHPDRRRLQAAEARRRRRVCPRCAAPLRREPDPAQQLPLRGDAPRRRAPRLRDARRPDAAQAHAQALDPLPDRDTAFFLGPSASRASSTRTSSTSR
jgi:hypothetical protein